MSRKMKEMQTVALRFAENFAPEGGTIRAHQKVIDDAGYVWYGKLGAPVSSIVVSEILMQQDPRIQLIHSGGYDRWWAHIDEIKRETPEAAAIPAYYRDKASDYHCWFKVVRFERAEKDVMSRCFVSSSGTALTEASRHSMSPSFIIEYEG